MDERTAEQLKIQDHELYLDERKLLIDAVRESSRTFDKAILTFGSGAFGFSVAILKNVVPTPAAGTLWILATSWTFFAVSLLIILLSFMFSQHACTSQIERDFDVIVRKKRARPNVWSTTTRVCNYGSILLLSAGIALWIWFVCANLGRGGR